MTKLINASAKAVSQEPGMPTTTQDQRSWNQPHKPRLRMVAFIDNDKTSDK